MPRVFHGFVSVELQIQQRCLASGEAGSGIKQAIQVVPCLENN